MERTALDDEGPGPPPKQPGLSAAPVTPPNNRFGHIWCDNKLNTIGGRTSGIRKEIIAKEAKF
jgi:hypothetical protein